MRSPFLIRLFEWFWHSNKSSANASRFRDCAGRVKAKREEIGAALR
jgi:hypothetical protein